MRKKPYKASELFNEICKQLTLPDILDYYRGEDLHDEEIRGYEWDFGNDLEFGTNEGIYLTMYAKSKDKEIMLGMFKTLVTSAEAMHKMASLLADFIIVGTKFVNENLDDFTWSGYNVKPVGALCSYDCTTIERAKKRYEELRQKYDDVVVFDYANRKEIRL